MQPVIRFYRANEPYGFMSNFSAHPITLDGKTWPTSEHYFQAQKFSDPQIQERIRTQPGPGSAARTGRDRSLPLRPDWENVKDQVMLNALEAKFSQHPDIREELIATEDAELIEHTVNDDYWADGGDGSGKNMLGILLMTIRERLQRN